MTIDPTIFTGLGAVLAVFLCGLGSAIGSAHGGIFALRNSSKDKLSCLAFIPIIQAGVLSVYGIIVGVMLSKELNNGDNAMTVLDGTKHFSAGLSVGLSSLASGWGMASFLKQCNEPSNDITITSTATTEGGTDGVPQTHEEQQREPLLTVQGTGDKGQGRDFAQKLILVMIFLEAIGFYGFLLALVLLFSQSRQ